MSYNKKITFLILFFFTLIINGILYIILADRTTYSPVTFEDIASRIPSHLKVSNYDRQGWRGIYAANMSNSRWVYLLKKPHAAEVRIEDYLHPGQRFKRQRVGENIYFGFRARGKNYRRYIYVFVFQNSEYWIESGCSNSSFLSIKKIADTMLEFFVIKDSGPWQNIEEIKNKTTAFISPRYSQSVGFLLSIVTGAMIFSLAFTFIIFYFSGLPPAQRPGGLVKEFAHVSVRVSSSRLQNQGLDAYVAATGNGFLIYLFKKLNVNVLFSELAAPGQVKVGKTLLLKQDYISFSFSNTAAVFPKRKSPVRRAKIILYLKFDRIRELLLNTNFPYKEKITDRFSY